MQHVSIIALCTRITRPGARLLLLHCPRQILSQEIVLWMTNKYKISKMRGMHEGHRMVPTARNLSLHPEVGMLKRRHVQALEEKERKCRHQGRAIEVAVLWMFALLVALTRPERYYGVHKGRQDCQSGATINVMLDSVRRASEVCVSLACDTSSMRALTCERSKKRSVFRSVGENVTLRNGMESGMSSENMSPVFQGSD